MAREVKKALNRPPTRKLVRWNDDLDELLLLTIQSVCNKEGVRLPWAEVAKSMGNNVTDGAIIQHLAKLRIRRVEKNKQVPPPLRRGGGYFGASKTSEAPVTPLSPKEKPEAVMERRANRRSQTKIKVEKGAARKITDISSDSDEEWTSDTPKTKKSKQRRPQKKRKITSVEPERLEPPVDDVASDDDATVEVTEASQRSDELVAVGADFLDFLGKNKAQEEDRAATPSEDEYQPDTNKSLIVTLKPGTNNMRRLKYKGTGVFQDRDPEQRWEMPAPGPNGEFWGFSRDYYGPIPQSAQHSHNPGLLRGEWPREVALRQYEAPQAVTWSNETYHPDPRLVHPAVFLEDPNCEPQLKFHRKLRTTEESNPGARVFDQGGPAYQSYANTHRELPTYRDSSWTTTPTHSYRHLSLRDSGYSSDFDTVRPKTEEKPDTHQLLDTKHTGTNDALVDRLEELPPGKIFADGMIDETLVAEAAGLDWWQR
ncbi:hypothetical protein TMatcc_002091 [Talaromyces marneffei ATCC 18224]|uniref:Myb-like domain-containing protein n=2 Tax=Talaromyces marneffei TaxID=37727 RepID=B6QIN7_TALMQ|nr:conserved hypothetical protein [Talaromyces marneffei ATCC 18224]KAE8552080.1 hypothetical protein EYB25_005974 [Talaromyces marneffei]